MAFTSLRTFRVGLKKEELIPAAKALLERCQTFSGAQEIFGWYQGSEAEFLRNAFHPQPNASEWAPLVKKVQAQRKLKAKRMKRKYPDFIKPRKGISGWFQKKDDKKELALPVAGEMFEWLQKSNRLVLLTYLHDMLLSSVSFGEAREVPFEEISALPMPFVDLVHAADENSTRTILKVLTDPIHKIAPSFLAETIHGYVIYQPEREFAYYYA